MKRTTALLLALVICFGSVFALASCSLQEMLDNADYTEEYTADNKEGSVELIKSFFEETLKDPNVVITYKNKNGDVIATETVKGTSSYTLYDSGSEVYAFKKGEHFYVAMIDREPDDEGNIKERRYYYCSDSTKPGYYADSEFGTMESVYEGHYCTFMGKYNGANLISMLPEAGATFSCVSNGEKKDGVTTGSLTVDYTSGNGTLKLTADSKENLVQSLRMEINDKTDAAAGREMTWTFVYGSASITLPDTDAWDREAAEKAEKIEANHKAIEDRDEFLCSALGSGNVVVTVQGPSNGFTETLANDIDCVDYGTYKTYTYTLEDEEGNWNAYYVFDGEDMKYYMINSDYYGNNCYVWYNMYVGVYDVLEEDAEFVYGVDGDTMTFAVKQDGDTVATITAVKSGDEVVSAAVTLPGDIVFNITFEYGTGALTEPDLTGFADATPTEEAD